MHATEADWQEMPKVKGKGVTEYNGFNDLEGSIVFPRHTGGIWYSWPHNIWFAALPALSDNTCLCCISWVLVSLSYAGLSREIRQWKLGMHVSSWSAKCLTYVPDIVLKGCVEWMILHAEVNCKTRCFLTSILLGWIVEINGNVDKTNFVSYLYIQCNVACLPLLYPPKKLKKRKQSMAALKKRLQTRWSQRSSY